MSWRTTFDFTYLNQTSPTGDININIDASNSEICDELTIMFNSAINGYNITYYGDISNSSNSSVSVGTYSIYTATQSLMTSTQSITIGTQSTVVGPLTVLIPAYITSVPQSNTSISSVVNVGISQSAIYKGTFNGTKFIGITYVE